MMIVSYSLIPTSMFQCFSGLDCSLGTDCFHLRKQCNSVSPLLQFDPSSSPDFFTSSFRAPCIFKTMVAVYHHAVATLGWHQNPYTSARLKFLLAIWTAPWHTGLLLIAMQSELVCHWRNLSWIPPFFWTNWTVWTDRKRLCVSV